MPERTPRILQRARAPDVPYDSVVVDVYLLHPEVDDSDRRPDNAETPNTRWIAAN